MDPEIPGFLTRHSAAERRIYAVAPYDWTISGYAGWQRTNVDRPVHLYYGLRFGPVLFRRLRETEPGGTDGAALTAVEVVLCTNCPSGPSHRRWRRADNGQQSDIWDTQKDMTLATGGATVAVTIGALLPTDRSPDAPECQLSRRR